jgi:hypothetical protein
MIQDDDDRDWEGMSSGELDTPSKTDPFVSRQYCGEHPLAVQEEFDWRVVETALEVEGNFIDVNRPPFRRVVMPTTAAGTGGQDRKADGGYPLH